MYRTIDAAFWTDPECRRLSTTARHLFLYLITNPHSHVAGLYYIPRPTIEHETGIRGHALDEALVALAQGYPTKFLAAYDPENEIVFIRRMFYRQGGKGDRLESAAGSQLITFRHSPMAERFAECYPHIAKRVKYTHSIGYPSVVPSCVQEQEQEQEQNSPLPPRGGVVQSRRNGKPESEPEGFSEFFAAYPRHVARAAAAKAWCSLAPGPDLRGMIMAAVPVYAAAVRDREPDKIAHPSTWLNGRRWEDEPPKPKAQTLKPLHPNQRAQLDAVRAESERNRQEIEREAAKPVSREAQAKITELVAGMKPMPRSPAKNAAAEVERLQQWDKRRNQ